MSRPHPFKKRKRAVDYLFYLRASFHGMLHWTCPGCATKHKSRLHPLLWYVECGNYGPKTLHNDARHPIRFIPALNFIPMPTGRITRPADWMIATRGKQIDPMPVAEIQEDVWRSGMPVHKLVRNQMEQELEAVEAFFGRCHGWESALDELDRMRLIVAYWYDVDEHGHPKKENIRQLLKRGIELPVRRTRYDLRE